jgi:hypothetical protein
MRLPMSIVLEARVLGVAKNVRRVGMVEIEMN